MSDLTRDAALFRGEWWPEENVVEELFQAGRRLSAALDAAENDREWLEDKLKEEGDLVMLLAERGNALANRAAEYVHAFDTDAPDRRERCLRYTTALREWRAVPLGRDTPE